MVPLRLEATDNCRVSTPNRPGTHLELRDVTAPSAPRRITKRHSMRRVENLLFVTAAAAVLMFFVVSFAASLWHSIQARYSTPSAVFISKTVAPGDTLWKYAARYGDPNTYILNRIDRIARVNHLNSDNSLAPGQHLRIPVTNPVVLAQIQHHFSGTPVASR